jgi:polygalacturonase
MKMICVLFGALYAATAVSAGYNVRDFGAKGDGRTKDTAAIQRAIDACAKTGGRVVLPAGTYLSGSIWLKDNVELHLEEGALLQGSPDLADYNEPDAYPQNWGSKNEGWSAKHLILAVEKRNVAITGKGVIDGNARAFFAEKIGAGGKVCWRQGYVNVRGEKADQGRPGPEIVFVESSGITLRDVTLRNMSCWTCLFHGSENITVGGVTIRNDLRYANTDGFDVDSCRNVTIGDCDIVTGDDAIAIRGNPARLKNPEKVCENIRVSNIVCRVSADGVRVGVGRGTIRNVKVSDMKVLGSGRGIHVQCCYGRPKRQARTGVDISDVTFERIEIADTCVPVCVAAGSPTSSAILKDVHFKGIRSEAFSSVVVAGNGDTRPENVTFEDCSFKIVPVAEAPVPDYEYGELDGDPNGAFRIEKSEKVVFAGCSLVWSEGVSKTFNRAFSVHDSPQPDVDLKSDICDRSEDK